MADNDHTASELVARATRMSMSRRKALARAAALGLSIPALSALNSGGASAAPQSAATRQLSSNASIDLSFYHDKAPWEDYFKQMSDLSAEQIDISFTETPYADTTSYQQVINSSLPTGDAPDLFTWWSGYRMEDLYKSGNIRDMSDVWTAAVAAGDLPESLAAAFSFDGKPYAVPQSTSSWVVFYNKKVFADNSVEVPATWDDFLAAAATIKEAGVTPFFATVDGRWPAFIWFEELLIKRDPQFYIDLCNGDAKYTDDTAVQALADWKDLIDKEYFTELDTPMDQNFVTLFAAGEVAMIPVGTWFQQQFLAADLVPGEDYDVFILPNIDPAATKNVMIVETGAIILPNGGKNDEAAVKLATWWDQVDAQTKWSGLLGDIGANPKVEHDNVVLSNVNTLVADGNYELLQRYWEATPPAIVENAVDELARFMLNPDEAQSVLEAIQKIADEEWAKRQTA